MLIPTIVMAVIALGLLGYGYTQGAHVEGMRAGIKMLASILPLLLAVFLVAGLVETLVPKEKVAKLLGDQAGFRGIILGCVAGAVTPGGPYVSFPLVATIYHAGAGVGTVVAFLTAWSLWAVSRLPIELGFVGPRLVLIRLASTLVFPPLAGLIAQKLFSGWAR